VQDLDGSGEIGIEEVSGSLFVHNIKLIHHAQFKPLWDYVKVRYHSREFCVSSNPLSQQWREMFESFDYNQDGIIDAAELSNALGHYKCVLFLLKYNCALYL